MQPQEHPYYFTWCAQNKAKPLTFKNVSNTHYFLEDNHSLHELSSISYSASFGFKPPAIAEAIKHQCDQFMAMGPKAVFDLKERVSRKLLDYLELPSGKLFYTTSGAESVENALKMARDLSQKKIVLARKDAYHGASMGALTVTGDWRHDSQQLPRDWMRRIPGPRDINSLAEIEKIILETGPEQIAAIILETVTGGNGVIIPELHWLKGVRALCDRYQIFLIMDEVVGGFHRTLKPMALSHFDPHIADFITFSKGITGACVPFGALWTSSQVASRYADRVLSCGLTNYAHPLGLSALEAVLHMLQTKSFQQNLKACADELQQALEKIKRCSPVIEVRSFGMLAAIDFLNSKEFSLTQEDLFKAGLSLILQDVSQATLALQKIDVAKALQSENAVSTNEAHTFGRIILAPFLNDDPKILKQSLEKLHMLFLAKGSHPCK